MFSLKKQFTFEVAESLIKNIIKAEDRPSFKELYNLFDIYEDKDWIAFLEFQLFLADMIIFTKVSEYASTIFRSKLFSEKYTITNENIIQQINFKPEKFQHMFDSYQKFMNPNNQKSGAETLFYFNDFLQPMVKNFMSGPLDYISAPLIFADFISIQNSIQHNLYEKIKNYK